MKNQYEIDYQQGYDTANDKWLDRVKQAREEIQDIKENEPLISKGGFECFGFRQKTAYEIKNEVMEILDKLIAESEEADDSKRII